MFKGRLPPLINHVHKRRSQLTVKVSLLPYNRNNENIRLRGDIGNTVLGMMMHAHRPREAVPKRGHRWIIG